MGWVLELRVINSLLNTSWSFGTNKGSVSSNKGKLKFYFTLNIGIENQRETESLFGMPVPDPSEGLMVCPGTGTKIHPKVLEAIRKEPIMFLGRAKQLGWHPGDQAHDNMVHAYLQLRKSW